MRRPGFEPRFRRWQRLVITTTLSAQRRSLFSVNDAYKCSRQMYINNSVSYCPVLRFFTIIRQFNIFSPQKHIMLPLMIDCTHKKIIIIGGGSVAARKAAYLSDADVIMYSKTFHPDVPAYVTRVSCTIAPDRDAILKIIGDAFLVIVTTSDPDLNTFIVGIARDEKILCNCADGEPGDVIIPAQIQKGEIVIAVSSGGTSPALSQFLRVHLEEMFPELEQIAAFLAVLKLELKQSISEQKRRSIILHNALRDPVLLEQINSIAKTDIALRTLAVRYIEEYN